MANAVKEKEDASIRTLAGEREERLLNAFFVLYKTARIVDESNATFGNQLSNFIELFVPIAKEAGGVTIKILAGHYFVNERKVKFDGKGLSGAGSVIEEWRKVGVGGIRFEDAIDRDEIARFFKFMASIKPDESNLESAAARLMETGLNQISLLSLKLLNRSGPKMSEEQRKQFRLMARSTFVKAITVVQDVMVSTSEDREISSSKTKRVVHSLIDQISRDSQSMLELASIKDYDDYTYAHSTNVAVYALTMGVRLGLDRARLSQLGFGALFHDIGKVRLPHDLIIKPDAYDEDDWLQMQRHPLLGAKTILRNMKLDIHTARAARIAFEHHINTDYTGYPMLHYNRREPILFSKIVSIVDSFDALTSGRIYLRKSMQPEKVLKKMRSHMSAKFDPFLLKLFNDIIGIYPPGTLVLLSTREIALVLTANEKDPNRPYVKIVGDDSGLMEEPLWVDLSDPQHAQRKIVRQIEPERYGLNTRDFVLQD